MTDDETNFAEQIMKRRAVLLKELDDLRELLNNQSSVLEIRRISESIRVKNEELECLPIFSGSFASGKAVLKLSDFRKYAPPIVAIVDSDVSPRLLSDFFAELSAIYSELSDADELVINEGRVQVKDEVFA